MAETCFVVMEDDQDPRGKGYHPVFVILDTIDHTVALSRAAELYRNNGYHVAVKDDRLLVYLDIEDKKAAVRVTKVSVFRS